jgi:methylmalonyl-CoA mutase cobalamin-binding subunit
MDAHTNLTGKRPTIHLLTFGDANIRNIRALFARNLLGCGGFDISEGENMSNTADAVVLCSSDMEYFTHKESIILPLIQEHKIIILAGKPKGWEELEVNMAIYAGMDIVQCINSLYSYINIQ